MEHPQRKTWTMKHPALAKAFAIMFAVMSVILLFGGVSGIGKAQEDNAERLRYEKRYAERIANYVDLSTQLENSITYEELWEELEKEIEQHDEDAAEHRTDLALHTAEKGGYTMGANMIWEAMPDPNAMKRQLAIAKDQLEAQAGQIEMLKTGISGLEQLYAAVQGCDMLLEQLEAISSPPSSGVFMVEKPQQSADPVETEPPTDPVETEPPADPAETEPPTDPAETEPPTDPAETEPPADPAEIESPAGPEESDPPAVLAAEANAAKAKRNIRLVRYADQGADTNPMAQLYAKVSELGVPVQGNETPDQLAGMIESVKSMYVEKIAEIEENGMTLEQMKAALKAYNEGVAAIAAGEAGVAAAQGQLENIWYELGQLDDEHEELIAVRDRLNEEAARLSKEIVEADELHELENDRTSAKLLLTSVKEVDDMVEAGGEIVPSAETHLENYKAQTKMQYSGWLASCVLAILGGIAGLAAIPAAYELIHKRAWLIVPVIVSIICAAAAEAVYYGVGLGWWYVGMFAAIIGLIHLAIVTPKEKKPGAA